MNAPVKDHSQHTIGVEFSSRTVKLGEKRIKLQVRLVFARTLAFVFMLVVAMGYSWTGTIPVGTSDSVLLCFSSINCKTGL